MNEIHVLVAAPLEESQLGEIAGLDPRLKVHPAAKDFAALLAGGAPGADFAGTLARAEVLYTVRAPPGLAGRCPNLRWVHLASHGLDHLPDDLRAGGMTVTTAQGAFDGPIAEYVLMLMLMLAKRAPRLVAQQQKGAWKYFSDAQEMSGLTLGLVGFGSIGRRVARYARALGMKVIATRRSAAGEPDPDTDQLVPPGRLGWLLEQSDFVVVAVPLTALTRGLIGSRELGRMKPTAFLINVSRGAVVDEGALVRALREKKIGGAALDVFRQEPLPPESPFWKMESVIVSPHMSGRAGDVWGKANGLFRENLMRYLKGEPLLNVFDPARGY
jgi:phosphoglycerate dehydrogenase-like enzyme